MGIILPDKLVLDALIAGENLLLANPDGYIPLIFDGYPASVQNDIIQFYRQGVNPELPEESARRRVKKFLGYPSSPEEIPCWAVVLSSASESRRAIGEVLDDASREMRDDPDQGFIARGALWDGVVSVITVAPNPDLTAYLQAVATYLLLLKRDWLHEQGIFNQQLSCQDLRPDPESLPSISFVRETRLSCSFANFLVEQVEALQGIDVDPTWTSPDGVLLEEA